MKLYIKDANVSSLYTNKIQNSINTCNYINFIDYDGSIVKSISINEVNYMSTLPIPSDKQSEGLTFDCWNWTLDEIKQQITDVGGDVNVGAIYHTTDGNTHITCKPIPTNPTVNIRLTPTVANAVTIDWGDGNTDTFTSTGQATKTHTYTGTTDSSVFDIKISCSNGTYSFPTYICETEADNKASTFTDVKLSSQVTSLGNYCFNCCYTLKSVTIPNSVTSLGNYCFQTCSSLKSVTIPSSISNISMQCFYFCMNLQYAAIPKNIESINNNAYGMCYNLKSFTISNSITTLGGSSFDSCFNLKSIAIPDGTGITELNCFPNDYTLKSFRIPSSVTNISNIAFKSCSLLTSITIPVGVTNIGNSSFQYCSSLTKVYCLPTTPPTLSSSACFDYTHPSLVIYVPRDSLSAYQTASNWSNLSSKIVGISI